MEWYKDPKFRKLQDRWYKKLARLGFNDIEQDDNYLNQTSYVLSASGKGDLDKALLSIEAKTEYYSICRRFLQAYQFESEVDRKIFEYHSEGVGIRDIVKKVKLRGRVTNRRNINEKLMALIKEMKTGKYG